MGFEEGCIILDNEDGIYIAGQPVFGRLVFEQEDAKNIHGIYVSFKGFCKVHWTTKNRRDGRSNIMHHEASEEYFHSKSYIIGDASGEYYLKPGHHDYTFSFPIPPTCPSSFEGEHGHIRYRVKVAMLTPGMFALNKEKKATLRIHAPLDLNQRPSYRGPLEFELDKTYCCWCLSAGFSEVRVKLPVGGYCPGQIITMDVRVSNQSSVEIKELKFSIKEKTKFEATTNPNIIYESKTLATTKKGPIPAHTTESWQVELEVPAMDITNLNGCQYIDLMHYFKVSTTISGCHRGTEASHGIVIGNVPFIEPQQIGQVPGVNYYPSPVVLHQPYPTGSSYPTVPPYSSGPSYPNASPPNEIYYDGNHNEYHNPIAFMPLPSPHHHIPENPALDNDDEMPVKSPSPPPAYSKEPEDLKRQTL